MEFWKIICKIIYKCTKRALVSLVCKLFFSSGSRSCSIKYRNEHRQYSFDSHPTIFNKYHGRSSLIQLPGYRETSTATLFLKMLPLNKYPIPEGVLHLQENGNKSTQALLDDIRLLISMRQEFRKSQELYFLAYHWMINFEEAVDELIIGRYNRNPLRIDRVNGKNELCVTLGPGSDEFLAAMQERQVHQLKLTPRNGGKELIGKKTRISADEIYLKISAIKDWIPNDLYDVSFLLNRTVYQLQHNALDFIQKHKVFDIILNNSNFGRRHITMEECEHHNESVTDSELNEEQTQAVNCIINGKNHPLPYLLYGPPGTGKTKTVVAAIVKIVETTRKNILVCAQSNAACDEITDRLSKYLTKNQLFRMYSLSYDTSKISSEMESYCNMFGDELQFPPLEYLYTFRVLVCTLSTSGCLSRARHNACFKNDHFGFVFIDECASAHETMALIPIAGVCTSPGKIHANIALIGDPKQLDAVTKSDWSMQLGFNISWFERLFNLPIYECNESTGKFNKTFITQLVQNYRNHPAILKIPIQLFYDNKLKAIVHTEKITLDIEGLLSNGFPIIFHSVQGICRRPENDTSSFNMDEVNVVMEYITKILESEHDIAQSDIGVVSPYKLQCKIIKQKRDAMNYGNITIGSAEVFQGQERKVMIMSTVRSGSKFLGDFLSNAQRFNVMITRARNLLIIVGDPHTLQNNPNWLEFIKYCFKNRCLIQGKRHFHFSDKENDVHIC